MGTALVFHLLVLNLDDENYSGLLVYVFFSGPLHSLPNLPISKLFPEAFSCDLLISIFLCHCVLH